MKKVLTTLPQIKSRIERLQGQMVDMKVNCGRKKIVMRQGVIDGIYQSVFTVKMINHTTEIASFSYTDILCGNLKLRRTNKDNVKQEEN